MFFVLLPLSLRLMSIKSYMLEKELLTALDNKGERVATKFLKEHPEILTYSFNWTAGHSMYVLNEFPISSRYRTDFVVLLSYSGTWEINFIELENTDDMVITQAGKPSQRFNSAISQINDWHEYIERNRQSIQKDLSDWCMKKDLLKWSCNDKPPTNFSGNELKDPDSFLIIKYHIVIGRRQNITKEIRRKMNQYTRMADLSIHTFDRFVDIAKNFDKHHASPEASVCLTETNE